MTQHPSRSRFFMLLVFLASLFAVCYSDNNRNPYQILGVGRDASQKDIQKSYKSLCLRYHPDKNVHRPSKERQKCEETFKEIQHAYSQIGDAQARRSYELKERYGFGGTSSTTSFDAADAFFRSFPTQRSPPGSTFYFTRGADGRPRFGVRRPFPDAASTDFFGMPNTSFKSIYKQKVQVPLEQLYTGTQVEFQVLDNVWTRWRAAIRGKSIYICLYQGLIYSLPLMRTSRVLAAIVGMVIVHVTLPKPDPSNKYVSTLPRGSKGNNGTQVRFQQSRFGEPEVIFEIQEAPHPRFVRVDNELHTKVRLTKREADRGCTKRIAALDPSQDAIVVEIPPQTAKGATLRIRGKGWPTRNADIQGDLVVQVEIKSDKGGRKGGKRKSQ